MKLSYNGWEANADKTAIDIVDLTVTIDGATYSFPGGCRAGDVHTLFSHFLPRFHRAVESLADGGSDEWGYAYRKNRNADNMSCHASGTAVDVNSSEHPNGSKRTFTLAQVTALRSVLDTYEGVIKWGGDFRGTRDEMHFEINGTPTDVHRVAKKLTTDPEGDDMTAEEHKLLVEIRKIVAVTDDRVNKLRQEFDAYVKTHQ